MVVGALLLVIPLVGVWLGIGRIRAGQRAAVLFTVGCAVFAVSWLVFLLTRLGVWRSTGAPENLLAQFAGFLPDLVPATAVIGVGLIVLAHLAATGRPAARPDPDRRRPWLVAGTAGLVVVAMGFVAAAMPARVPDPTLVSGVAVRVDHGRGVFAFARDGGGVAVEYPLDNPMWVDRTGQKHVGGRPECLTGDGAVSRAVELALVDVRGVPGSGFGNLRLVLSVRCLG
ncbi:hypothetical protein [Actinokineospora terrae]|uniref:Uncharacterized protein n=1 Tax=Actinokineospora terrae TaxID=155974 RepID=A0A1H9XKZ7_9PSEU|nr:hypothetical protein [Actinokineospora terrae]SES46860.1 hypothetical protein SAMN04487818_116132 [Actinokineospora terrae]